MTELAKPTLRDYLSRYNQYTVPDIYYLAWRALIAGIRHKDSPTIIALAEKDFAEETRDQLELRLQRKFNDGRVKSDDLHRGSSWRSNSLKRREVNG